MFVAESCFGHGNPIQVDVAAGRLTVSGGLALPYGFVDMAFDDHEDSYLEDLGEIALAITPGFVVNGMTPGSELHLEVISRPDFTLSSTPQRWLWFWDKSTQQVEIAPQNPTVELASEKLLGNVILTQFDAPTTGPSLLALEPLPNEIGTHQHPIAYLLDNSPPAEFGAYGFFVRLTSPNYLASEPFLIALNHGLSAEEYGLAARQINAAANLPGDFNGDDAVNGADFLAWQRSFGSTTELSADGSLNGTVDADDLALWKANFGRTWPASGSGAAMPTPEPATFALFAWSILAVRLRLTGSGSFCHWRRS